ncbi:unnamed protein product [Musa hybrid cultivar]
MGGGSGKWRINSLIGLGKQDKLDQKAEEGCSESGSRRWKFWKKSSRPGASESHRSASEEEEVAALYASTNVCSPHNDFKVVRQAFAAIRIQAAFRGCLSTSPSWNTVY